MSGIMGMGLGLGVVFIVLGIAITIVVFYLKNLQDLLKECSARNQQMPPGNVWLMFIPIFNIVYPFIMYPKISESVKREFEERDSPQGGDYLKGVGIAMAILSLCSTLFRYVSETSVIGSLISLSSLVLLIIYWVKTAEMKNKLRMLPKQVGSVRISENPDLLD